jgi:hypothetical protein
MESGACKSTPSKPWFQILHQTEMMQTTFLVVQGILVTISSYCTQEKVPGPLWDCEANMLRDFLPGSQLEDKICVRHWAKLRLPTGQNCYSIWKEMQKPIKKHHTAHNVKVQYIVFYFMHLCIISDTYRYLWTEKYDWVRSSSSYFGPTKGTRHLLCSYPCTQHQSPGYLRPHTTHCGHMKIKETWLSNLSKPRPSNLWLR